MKFGLMERSCVPGFPINYSNSPETAHYPKRVHRSGDESHTQQCGMLGAGAFVQHGER